MSQNVIVIHTGKTKYCGYMIIDAEDQVMIQSTGPGWNTAGPGYVAYYRRGGKMRYLHRFLTGDKSYPVDHANRMPQDNRKSNLIVATRSQNAHNWIRPVGKSGYHGVECNIIGNSFRARVRVDGKNIAFGSYPTAKEAALAYNREIVKYRGASAVLNHVV